MSTTAASAQRKPAQPQQTADPSLSLAVQRNEPMEVAWIDRIGLYIWWVGFGTLGLIELLHMLPYIVR